MFDNNYIINNKSHIDINELLNESIKSLKLINQNKELNLKIKKPNIKCASWIEIIFWKESAITRPAKQNRHFKPAVHNLYLIIR